MDLRNLLPSSNFEDRTPKGVDAVLNAFSRLLPSKMTTRWRHPPQFPDYDSPELIESHLARDQNWGMPDYHTDPFSGQKSVLNPDEVLARNRYLSRYPFPTRK